MLVIRAWANGLRTIARCSVLVNWMLSVHFVRPVISRASSLRRRALPISFRRAPAGRSSVAVMTHLRPPRSARPHDVVVAGAPAQVALQAETDLLLGGVRVLVQQVDRLHDHAGSAVAALEGVALAEGLLHGVQLPVLGEALDRGDLVAVRLHREHVAGLHARAVEVDGAGSAVAGVAADDGAGLAEAFTQVVDEKHAGFDVVGVRDPVDLDADTGHGQLPWCGCTRVDRYELGVM